MGSLHAFADDISILAQSERELEMVANELENMGVYRLHLNVKKCEILAVGGDQRYIPKSVAGIEVNDQVKYLGMKIAKDKNQLRKDTAATIKRYMAAFKGRLRVADLEVKE